MNSQKIIKGKLFLAVLVTMLCGMVAGGCSDDKDELEGKQYGYVQFKLYKSSSYTQEEKTRTDAVSTRASGLDKLIDAQKVEIEMQHNGMSITQTLVLNAYNENNAEYGMRSEKLKLLTGSYKIIGYKLFDKLDEVITGISTGEDETFEVVSRGLTTKDLVTDSQTRGTVTFKLVKDGLSTRAAGDPDIDYLFSDIKIIDVTVTNTFTRVPVTIKNLKVSYKEEYEEHPNPDYTDDSNQHKDKYKDIGTAKCDSVVWLPAGTYQVTSYTIYKKSGIAVTTLDSRSQLAGEMFIMKVYGGNTSVAPTSDDVEQATSVFREELEILKSMFTDYDLSSFLNPDCDPVERYRLLSKAAEYVFASTQVLNAEGNGGSYQVSFKTYFLKTVKRMRSAFDICQPSGNLGEEESALAQCFMAIAGFVRKMSGTSEVDTDTMNRAVSKMVEEALKYNQVENVFESGEEEDIFSVEYFEKLSDVKMPATKLELLIKMLRKQIKEFGKVNRLAAKTFQEMLEKTIAEYHERRKHLTAEEAGATQETASENIIRAATEQALAILSQMNESRESFRKIGLTFEEKSFYDILISLRDRYNFEYGTDKEIDGVIVNDKCKSLAKKIKEIIDTKSSYADWLNNQNVRNELSLEIKICLVKNGYPPQYSPEVFTKVMEQVENFEENY